MILSVLCIYNQYAFTWCHWFWSIWSLKKVDFDSNSTYRISRIRTNGIHYVAPMTCLLVPKYYCRCASSVLLPRPKDGLTYRHTVNTREQP